jgi:hypothetical protein
MYYIATFCSDRDGTKCKALVMVVCVTSDVDECATIATGDG